MYSLFFHLLTHLTDLTDLTGGFGNGFKNPENFFNKW